MLFIFAVHVVAQDTLNEEEIEDVWTVNVEKYGEVIDDWVIVASVNGKVTHGDRFRIRIPLGDLEGCTMGNTTTTFYTTNIDSQEKKEFIKNKILLKFFKEKNLLISLGRLSFFKWFSIKLNSLIFKILFAKLNFTAVLIPNITASP